MEEYVRGGGGAQGLWNLGGSLTKSKLIIKKFKQCVTIYCFRTNECLNKYSFK